MPVYLPVQSGLAFSIGTGPDKKKETWVITTTLSVLYPLVQKSSKKHVVEKSNSQSSKSGVQLNWSNTFLLQHQIRNMNNWLNQGIDLHPCNSTHRSNQMSAISSDWTNQIC